MDNAISQIHRGRDVIFNVFSRVFIDIPDDASDTLINETLKNILSAADSSENENLIKGAEKLRFLHINENTQWLHDTRLKLSQDYTSLFILGRNAVSIYESVYLSPEKLVKQEPWSEVKAFYTTNGFKKLDGNKTIEDHVSLEMQFMGLMSKQTADELEEERFESAEKKLLVQKEFYEKHIMLWIPDFCDKVIDKESSLHTSFYPSFAYLLKGFLEEDYSLIKELME